MSPFTEKKSMIFSEITEHESLTELYFECGLEITDDWTDKCGVFFSEALLSEEGDGASFGEITAAYSLSRRFGVTVLDYIAVKERRRKSGIGSLLIGRIKEKCKSIGVSELYLTAKAKGFFLKNGATEISDGSPLYVSLLGECAECPQREKECFPSVMRLEI